MKIKYVIIDYCLPILFSEGHQHAKFANIGKATSAGFCSFYNEEDGSEDAGWHVSCWGESISLKIKSEPENDAAIIKRLLDN